MLRRISAISIVCFIIFTSFIGVTGFSDSRASSRDFFEVETVIKGGVIGHYTSLALDSNDNPHVSYQFMGDLRYSNYDGYSWNVQTIDYDKYMGKYPSIAIDSNDYPRICYIGFDEVMCASWEGNSWDLHSLGYSYPTYKETSMVIDSVDKCHIVFYKSDSNNLYYVTYTGYVQKNWGIVENVGYLYGSAYPSIDIDNNDFAHISYYDNDNDDLKYAKWNGNDWDIEIVDSNGNVGLYNSIAIDKNGYPHISYYDYTNQDLKYAKWNGNSWNITTVDSTGEVGESTSLELDNNGYPHISYYYGTNRDLKYANWTGTSWNNYTIDSEGVVGSDTSIALDSYGYPHISYLDYTNEDVKYVKWTGSEWLFNISDGGDGLVGHSSMVLDNNGYRHISYYELINHDLKYVIWNGTTWKIENVDSEGDVGSFNSIITDSYGYPHISYFDTINDNIKYAKWTGSTWNIQIVESSIHCRWGGTWTSIDVDSKDYPQIIYYYNVSDRLHLRSAKWTGNAWDIQTIEAMGGGWYNDIEMTGPGVFASLKIDRSDKAHIAYYNWSIGDLKYANWTGTSWNIQTIDHLNSVGQYPSLALDGSDHPHISYYDATNGDLKYANWNGTAWSNITVDSIDTVGSRTSLALDNNDFPQISYFDNTNKAVKYARCTGSTWNIEIIDSEFYEWQPCDRTSIAIDNYGYAHICYEGNTDHYPTLNYATQKTIDTSLPSAPTLLTATPGNGQATLYWNAPSFNGGLPITNYKIYRGTEQGVVDYLTTVEAVLSYTDKGLTNDVEYFYKVSAVNSLGEGPLSNEINVTPLEKHKNWTPSTPIGLQAKAGYSYVYLSWTPPLSDGGSPITNYNIYRNKISGNPEFLFQTGNITYYNDTAVANGITYYYHVIAINAIGESPLSNEVSATPNGSIIPFTGRILYVGGSGPNNYTRIQDAIDASDSGDTVFVFDDSAPYYERIEIDKTINLIGEDRDTTIIDGGGYIYVIYIIANSVEIKGFTIKNGVRGILITHSSNAKITNNNISNNTADGIRVSVSANNTIMGNIFSSNDFNGLYLKGAINNNITSNNFVNNGIYFEGYQLSELNSHNIPPNNLVNGKPLHYYKNSKDINIDGIEVGQLIIVNCKNITVRNLEINYTDVGLIIQYSSNINVDNNIFTHNNRNGIYQRLSSNTTLTNNIISWNKYGIRIVRSSYNIINTNLILSSYDIGVDIHYSNNNLIVNNNITSNVQQGINIGSSFKNNITNNIISNNHWGILLHSASNNTISTNIISNNHHGVWLDSCFSTKIYHNNFLIFHSENQSMDLDGNNFWDNGYPTGGNYWSDYNGVDANGDGIGDTPYIIDNDSQDNYPLMEPWDITTQDPTDITIDLELTKTEFYIDEPITGSVTIYNNNLYDIFLNDEKFQTVSGVINQDELGVFFNIRSTDRAQEFSGFYNYPDQIMVRYQSSLVIDFELEHFNERLVTTINENLTKLSIGNYSIYTYFYYGEFPHYDILESNPVNFRIIAESSPPPGSNGGSGGSGTDDYTNTFIFTSAAGLVLVIVIFSIFIAATEIGKYKFAAMFAAPLYSRELKKRKNRYKDGYLRGKVHGYILGNPGESYNTIKKKLKLNNGALAYHLKVLEREREVRSERDGLYRRFYPYEGSITDEILELSKLQKRIVNLAKRKPGLSQKQISERLDVPTQKINYHVKILEEARVLKLEREANKTRCFLIEETS